MYNIVSFLDIIFGTCIILCNIMSAFMDLKFFKNEIYTLIVLKNIHVSSTHNLEKLKHMSDANISKSRNIMSASFSFEKSVLCPLF